MAKLGDICTINMGQSPESSSYNTIGEGLPFFQGNADFGDIHPTIRTWCSNPIKIAKKGDLLISVRAPIGALNIANNQCCIGRGLAALTNYTKNIYKDYLWFALLSKINELNSKGTGSTFKAINKKILAETNISLPSLEKQKQIAKQLSCLDTLLLKRKQQLSKLDQLVKSRFVEMFGDTRNNINNFKIYSIGDICSLKSGTSLPLNLENEGGDIPYIKVSDMNFPGNEQYITTSSRYVTRKTAGNGIFPVGSVIFPKRGGAIGTNKKRLTRIPICADLNIMGVIPSRSIISYYLLSYFNMIDLGKLDNGSSVPQLNNKDIAPLKILLPPLPLQEQFSAFVQQVDKAKSSVKQSLEKLETLKKSLMQEYFG